MENNAGASTRRARLIALAAAVASAMVSSWLLLSHGHNNAEQPRRLLRLSPFLDPKSTSARSFPSARLGQKVTVYLPRTPWQNNKAALDGPDRFDINDGFSVFRTGILQRYGTGRVQFVIESTSCPPCHKHVISHNETGYDGLCLVVRGYDKPDCNLDHLKCHFPTCKTMITADEYCRAASYDARSYYTTELPGKGYLPLGPRLDSWAALQKIQQNSRFSYLPASERRYAFNAIFSLGTNRERDELANIITERSATSGLNEFATFGRTFHWNATDSKRGHLGPDETMEVMLDSVFTLSPAGHNPECYRLYEAVEAGSIPIVVDDDLHISNAWQHRCVGSLTHWRESPILVLESWHDLYKTVGRLMDDPELLDEMQVRLRRWYDEYMGRAVERFEDFMLDSHVDEV